EAAKEGGIELGLRTGFGIPLGKSSESDNPAASSDAGKLSSGITGQIPIWLDVGYRINPNIYAGVYFQYGIILAKKGTDPGNCPDAASCSGSDMRFGVNAQYHLMPDQSFDPWVGVGIGYEILSLKESANGRDGKSSAKGLEFLNLQVGGDYKVAPNLGIGPFISFSLGQYSGASVDNGAGSTDIDFDGEAGRPKKALHEWLTIGLRGTFGL
ncbi:MAG: hypothetical protein ACXWUG_11955, partial [Polyangiales bacterium]